MIYSLAWEGASCIINYTSLIIKLSNLDIINYTLKIINFKNCSYNYWYLLLFFLSKNGGTFYIIKKLECTVADDDASCPALVGNQDNWVCCARCIAANHENISTPCPKETRVVVLLSFKKEIQSKETEQAT